MPIRRFTVDGRMNGTNRYSTRSKNVTRLLRISKRATNNVFVVERDGRNSRSTGWWWPRRGMICMLPFVFGDRPNNRQNSRLPRCRRRWMSNKLYHAPFSIRLIPTFIDYKLITKYGFIMHLSVPYVLCRNRRISRRRRRSWRSRGSTTWYRRRGTIYLNASVTRSMRRKRSYRTRRFLPTCSCRPVRGETRYYRTGKDNRINGLSVLKGSTRLTRRFNTYRQMNATRDRCQRGRCRWSSSACQFKCPIMREVILKM